MRIGHYIYCLVSGRYRSGAGMFMNGLCGPACFGPWTATLRQELRGMANGFTRVGNSHYVPRSASMIVKNGSTNQNIEHCNMIRGFVPKEKLLEWTVEDGWEPLCKFLDKPVPDGPFPHVNKASGWENHEAEVTKRYLMSALSGVAVLSAVGIATGAIVYKTMWWMPGTDEKTNLCDSMLHLAYKISGKCSDASI